MGEKWGNMKETFEPVEELEDEFDYDIDELCLDEL